MVVDPAMILAGPRGRRVCLEYARRCAELAGGAEESGAEAVEDASDAATALWWAGIGLEPQPPLLLTFGASPSRARERPEVTPSDVTAAFDGVEIVAPTADQLRDALAASVGVARYWQEPDGNDVLAATPELRPVLARVAEALAASPYTSWWASSVDLEDQWTVPWRGAGSAADPQALLRDWREHVDEEERRSARERPADPRAAWSGTWWSIPPFELVRTTRSLPGAGPARLWFEEDSLGGDEAVAVPVEAFPARVIEIDGPEAWADLCRRHPLEVTASRRHDWFRTTGRDGRWVVPDWSRVAAEADGVHLTVAGYLAAAGRAIGIGGDAASVVAGWNPDETYWFRGALARPAGEQRWVRVDDGWRRAG
jgi:hypothetical protein